MNEYQAAKAYAAEKDKQLKADHPGYEKALRFVHGDGSIFELHNAFWEVRDDMLVVFTEHHGYLIYPLDEIEELNEIPNVPL